MATDIVIPPLGESITEAVVAQWLKPDGAAVKRDEDIVELETDKVTMPLPSPAAGVLRHSAKQGQTVAVGSSVGLIDESAAASPATDRQAPAQPGPPQPDSRGTGVTPATSEDVRATPLARKIADEKGIDLVVPMAGEYKPMRATHIDLAVARTMIEVNLMGYLNVCAAVVPRVRPVRVPRASGFQ